MIIKKLNLKNFRNYSNITLNFSSNINLIEGENGSGKSNILEGISVLSNIKSFRNFTDSFIYKWGTDNYYCSAEVIEDNNKKFEIGSAVINGVLKKKYKIDNVEINRAYDYYGNLLTVIFSPDDINLINEGPEIRRKYFDAVISKLDKKYFNDLSEFKRILLSRNKLLKRINEKKINDFSELDIWDNLFISKSLNIVEKRKYFINEYSEIFFKEYNKISEKKDSPFLIYESMLLDKNFDDIKLLLNNKRKFDILRGSTSIGPQRDDYVLINNNKVKFINYGSQGQKRTAAIAFKISEKIYIEKKTEKKVILLLDDILSELDEKRRNNLLSIIDKNNQVIFSMVNSKILNYSIFDNVKIIKINDGELVNEI